MWRQRCGSTYSLLRGTDPIVPSRRLYGASLCIGSPTEREREDEDRTPHQSFIATCNTYLEPIRLHEPVWRCHSECAAMACTATIMPEPSAAAKDHRKENFSTNSAAHRECCHVLAAPQKSVCFKLILPPFHYSLSGGVMLCDSSLLWMRNVLGYQMWHAEVCNSQTGGTYCRKRV